VSTLPNLTRRPLDIVYTETLYEIKNFYPLVLWSLDNTAGEQVFNVLTGNDRQHSDFAARFFGNERVLNMLLSGTDRVTRIISVDPAFDSHRPMYEEQIQIIQKRGLKASDVIWALHTKAGDLAQTINDNLVDGQSVAIYEPEQLERLDTSFYSFKGNAQDALLGVFGHKDLFKS